MKVFFAVCSLLVAGIQGQVDNDWIDPTDMFNYDATSKTMRKPPEVKSYESVPTKRREFTEKLTDVPPCPDTTECSRKLAILEKEVQEQKKNIASSSQKSPCGPVFKRYLTKLLNEIQKLGLPNEEAVHYDAEVTLSRQAVGEIQRLIDGDESWKTGALDDALSKILFNFKLHDYEAWKWRFEDTFCVELSTVLGVFSCLLIIVLIICSEMWSRVSWFMQFKRLFAVSFFISIVWNWFYLYKIAFAEHQNNIAKMESVNDKCTGKIDWKDNLMEWFRSTWTLQDDPCKKYYEVLLVNPIFLVPPSKAIAVTITTFFTEPLKHVGQGISEFLRALLKDLPVTLQIPVLITIVLCILVFLYGSTQTVIQHGLMRPLRRRDRDVRQPAVEEHGVHMLQGDALAGGDRNLQAQIPQRLMNHDRDRMANHGRRPGRRSEDCQSGVSVENVGYAGISSEDDMDGRDRPDAQAAERPLPTGGVAEEERKGRRCGSDSSESGSRSEQPAQCPQTNQNTPVPDVPADEGDTAASGEQAPAISTPTQETSPVSEGLTAPQE
ncbi:chloride channel CLIC-like protein 1 [Brienomyrus brachyistius]|uniref:chloride channel CLIC-like protein 1 n=1 Tax=Brienomyrus brachyistius TaxID=42636 RepID=UPI0020B1B2A6|nr:chloride channel CLIC-like protein 1 [Brienomyrus brachyistius]